MIGQSRRSAIDHVYQCVAPGAACPVFGERLTATSCRLCSSVLLSVEPFERWAMQAMELIKPLRIGDRIYRRIDGRVVTRFSRQFRSRERCKCS
jgi:hypothetical protein